MKSSIFNFAHYPTIKQHIGNIEPGMLHIPFFTHGKWSSHELILYMLSISGKAKLITTTFSLSETTVIYFANAVKAGYISSFDLLINTSAKNMKLSQLLFAQNIADSIHLLNVHMKITLIENEHWKIVINQSANTTINPAWEAGVISTCPNLFEMYKNHINTAFEKSLPLYGTHNRTIK